MMTIIYALTAMALLAITQAASTACVDKVACNQYGHSVCTDQQYDKWATDNCPVFCGLCPTEPPRGVGVFRDENGRHVCKDKITDCAMYGKHICSDVKFHNWAITNCKAFCNQCDAVCVDKIQNCHDYGDDLCSNNQYYLWVETNCPHYCVRCQW